MFSILNTMATLRNYPPMVCKFLDNMTAFRHVRPALTLPCSYLLERTGFRGPSNATIGLPIATLLLAAYTHFRKGKD
jgi:hypothetical protein